MKKLLSSLACVALTFFVHAQQATHPGYIVRSAGDTVHGYLKEVVMTDHVTQVGFRTNPSDEFTLYSPTQVKAFQYDTVHVYRAVTFTNTLNNSAPQTAFARLLVSGECELYSLVDGDLFFLVRKDSIVHFLFDDDIHNTQVIRGNFRNQLNFFAVGCESIRRGIESISYNEESLIRYFRNLNACLSPNQSNAVFYQKPKAHWGFYAYAGGFAWSGKNYEYTGEARLRITVPQLNRGLSFNFGIRYDNTNRRVTDPQKYYFGPVKGMVNYKQISIPLTLQYNFTQGIVQPFTFVGMSLLRTNISSSEIYLPDIWEVYDESYNVALFGGVGVEATLTSFLLARLEWRYEQFLHFPTIGVSVRF